MSMIKTWAGNQPAISCPRTRHEQEERQRRQQREQEKNTMKVILYNRFHNTEVVVIPKRIGKTGYGGSTDMYFSEGQLKRIKKVLCGQKGKHLKYPCRCLTASSSSIPSWDGHLWSAT